MTDMRDALLLKSGDQPPSIDAEGCSSLLVPGNLTANGQAIAGQTWDLNPEDIEYVVAIRRQPIDGLETWSVTCAGCLTLMGINSCGVVVGTTNVKTWGSRPGIGYLATLHRMVRCHTASQASKILEGRAQIWRPCILGRRPYNPERVRNQSRFRRTSQRRASGRMPYQSLYPPRKRGPPR